MEDGRRSALLVVDVQKDFYPVDALPVRDGDRVMSVLNQHVPEASAHSKAINNRTRSDK